MKRALIIGGGWELIFKASPLHSQAIVGRVSGKSDCGLCDGHQVALIRQVHGSTDHGLVIISQISDSFFTAYFG